MLIAAIRSPAIRGSRRRGRPARAALSGLLALMIGLQAGWGAAVAAGGAVAATNVAMPRSEPARHHHPPPDRSDRRSDGCVLSGTHCKALSRPSGVDGACVAPPSRCGLAQQAPEGAAFVAAPASRLPLGSRAPPVSPPHIG